MTPSRRAALVTAGAAALAACSRPRPVAPTRSRGLDTRLLDSAFPALAQRAHPGLFSVGVTDLQSGVIWYWNTDRAFPLQNAFELPLAAAALAEADAGRLALSERLTFSAQDLSPPFSAINQKWPTPPDGYSASIPIFTLFTLAVRWGDNTAADLLMKRIGGPGMVTAWLQQWPIKDIRIDRYEREVLVDLAGLAPFRPAWKDRPAFVAAREAIAPARRQGAMYAYLADRRDTATLPAALALLAKLGAGQLLSAGSTAVLLAWMQSSFGGELRLKAGLPAQVRFAHKAGAAPTDLGFTPVENDLGIATWPDGRRFAIAAFLVGSTGARAQRDALFSDAARLIARAVG
ncbi:MAG TPA: serine hydrolase [Caulobacteraceae bacterium]|nr:serine hydrolase [Caulobacteraceae bacterium]